MSKIGRKSIALQDVKVELNGQEIKYSGKNASGVHTLPKGLSATLEGDQLLIATDGKEKPSRNIRQLWGLHRSLVANEIYGAHTLFEKQVKIVGLGYKAVVKGEKIELTLGLSHKVNYDLPKGVTVDVNKTGQLVTLKSFNKELVGKVGGELCEFRPTEPYKGTGVRLATDVVLRKAGKAKAS